MESNPSDKSESADFIEASNLVEKKIGHNKLQIEIDKLASDILEKDKLIDDLQSKLTNANQKNSSIEALNTQLTTEKTNLVEKLQAAQNSLQNSVSHDELKAVNEQLSKLQNENASGAEKLAHLQTLYDNSQKMYDDAAALAQELQFSNTNIHQNFDQLSTEYAVSIEQNNALQSQINALQNNIDSHLSEINSLKDQISHSKKVTLELNTIIEEKSKEIETLSSVSTPVIAEPNNSVIRGKSVRAQRSRR